jgi:superfamily II DNA or RNA helicase
MQIGAIYSKSKTLGDLTFITYASLVRSVFGDDAVVRERLAKNPQKVPRIQINPADFGLLIWDEAHFYLSALAQGLVQRFRRSDTLQVGLTATPKYYSGKELGISLRDGEDPAFGRCLYELRIPEAIRRGEMPPFENIIINTGLKSGLNEIGVAEEESSRVAKAINIPNRHLVIADHWCNATVALSRGGASQQGIPPLRLAGEATIVFCPRIKNAYAVANVLNAAISKRLKKDANLRAILKQKGINTSDPEFKIAAAIHTGATATHPGLSTQQQNEMIQLFRERKILILVSTSLLEQSIDEPLVSVVYDTIPRQTYPGVAQAGMRAARNCPGKGLYVVVNMQDSDNQTLTYLDFLRDRGSEEGVKVSFTQTDGERIRGEQGAPTPVTLKGLQLPNYQVHDSAEIFRSILNRELQERVDLAEAKLQEQSIPSQEPSVSKCGYYYTAGRASRFFTPKGRAHLNGLIQRLQQNDPEAEQLFASFLMPLIDRQFTHYQKKFPNLSSESIYDELIDALVYTILPTFKTGKPQKKWSRIQNAAHSRVRQKLNLKSEGQDQPPLSLPHLPGAEEIPDIPSNGSPRFIAGHDYSDQILGLSHHDLYERVRAPFELSGPLKMISQRDRDIWRRYCDGELQTQSAKVYEVTKSRIGLILTAIKVLINQALRREFELTDIHRGASYYKPKELSPAAQTLLSSQSQESSDLAARRANQIVKLHRFQPRLGITIRNTKFGKEAKDSPNYQQMQALLHGDLTNPQELQLAWKALAAIKEEYSTGELANTRVLKFIGEIEADIREYVESPFLSKLLDLQQELRQILTQLGRIVAKSDIYERKNVVADNIDLAINLVVVDLRDARYAAAALGIIDQIQKGRRDPNIPERIINDLRIAIESYHYYKDRGELF